MTYKLLLGIEHLMTGVQVAALDDDGFPTGAIITFERESPSIVRALCDRPMLAVWPANNHCEVRSTPDAPEPEKHGYGEGEWYAQVAGPAMNKAEARASENYMARQGALREDPPVLPWAVIQAMRRKHGAEADMFISALKWDGLNGCWFYEWAGMYCGVEPDGLIHT